MTETPMQRALKLVLALFPPGPADREDIVQNCEDILFMLKARGEDIPDAEVLIKEVESRVVVWQDRSTSLEDRTGHEEWLPERREAIDWRFWDRYRRYLEQVEVLPPTVISRLDDSTDRVLAKLEDPRRAGQWDRRGLVVGQVQSGKTGHYTGLVCKAADAGYKLIVVLAGMHNSLRSQTQLRLDQGLLGFDTQHHYRYDAKNQSRIGVGTLPGADTLKIGSLTTSHETGDFKRTLAQNLALPVTDMPVLLVTKKHGGILSNLIKWATQMHGEPSAPGSNELIVRDVPLLIVDDEADNASINTKAAGEDPTVINRRIRQLLKAFDKSAYVGYTATPFANIFGSIREDEDFGLDLFPRHFIEALKPPSNYFGPVRVFGTAASEDEVAVDPLPIFHPVEDYGDWIPDKHKVDWVPPEDAFPASLHHAILSFFLVCAARRARGDANAHNSMLIHTTRFQNVQRHAVEQVEERLTNLRYRLRYGDGATESTWEALRGLWESDFVPTTSAWGDNAIPLSWDEVHPHIQPAVGKIQVRTINGSSKDALEYYENREHGLSVIAVGGDKLSRGLTLEGLSVSYYLRATRMYDTLMQMGRWFGYRPRYEDLCRLYTTALLHDWYREITFASEELRSDFDDMASRRATPEDYGLRVRHSPAGLSVTAPSKMRSASTVTLTFSGDISETVTFDITDKILEDNLANLEAFVRTLSTQCGEPVKAERVGNYIWHNVPGAMVADEFFHGYRSEKMARRARPELIRRYIHDCVAHRELTEWTVVLVNNQQASAVRIAIGALDVGLTLRTPLNKEGINGTRRYTIRRILNPADESSDLSDSQIRRALAELREELYMKATPDKPFKEPQYPRGPSLRRQRSPRRGLLLLYPIRPDDASLVAEPVVGFAASFPFSSNTEPTTYKVNDIWSLLAFDQLEDDE